MKINKTIKKRKRNKAQLKIQQMTFMLLGVTLFFVLVGMLLLGFAVSGLKNKATSLEEENALLLVTKLANSPEFSCGEAFENQRINCVDADKVMILKEHISDYVNFWGTETNIEIRIIYPEQNSKRECTSRNYADCNTINLQSKDISSEHSNFIALCRKEIINEETYDKCELAKLMINYKDWRPES